MASSAKRKTTAVKLARESRLRERRQDKKAKKEARKLATAQGPQETSELEAGELEVSELEAAEPETDAVA